MWKCFRQNYHLISMERITGGLYSAAPHSVRRASSTSQSPDEKQSAESKDLVSAMIAAAHDRRTAYDSLIQKEQEAYERGRRHLANMMGEEPSTFTQDDINRSIRYLFPSGLFEKNARPLMLPPTEIYPPQKAAQFAVDGRPFDSMFYTGKPNYYNLMHETYAELQRVIAIEDACFKKGLLNPTTEKLELGRSEWKEKTGLERMIIEELTDSDYQKFVALMERILQQPFAKEAEGYVVKFRRDLVAVLSREVIEPIMYDESGRAYSTGMGRRKEASAKVTLKDQGSGQVAINGRSFINYFGSLENRIQVMFPLHFIGMLNRFDLECQVSGGGSSGQSGAIRLATAKALRSFVDDATIEKMRQAGLLTKDPRIAERKKPGQKGARKKFTWKKR
ncbi:28S ribosomal protein S9, mitochondrial-like [Asterias rubens]|uniref:28S ribosomal protein S9, mitochondrial-like n=1 Tax=Asterias rubens TaxID=7604 RepID=UPI001455AA77|nr:28S ribosomal protein S9, mitochondrial-like [Asterias rubens]